MGIYTILGQFDRVVYVHYKVRTQSHTSGQFDRAVYAHGLVQSNVSHRDNSAGLVYAHFLELTHLSHLDSSIVTGLGCKIGEGFTYTNTHSKVPDSM